VAAGFLAMPTYLGIDSSLEGTGLSLVSVTGHEIRSETVSTGVRGVHRLAAIKQSTQLFIPEDVVFAAFEGYAYHAVGQVFELGEVGGVLRLLVHERNISYVDVPPINLKKFATGSTSASKDQMVEAARAAGASPADDNQADAFFLAQIALACSGSANHLRRSQMEVVHRLLNPEAKKPRRRARRLVKNAV
jgi:Holliday junction resolvasome RuvABC endonuclease subunit